jgi:hypothetical protein
MDLPHPHLSRPVKFLMIKIVRVVLLIVVVSIPVMIVSNLVKSRHQSTTQAKAPITVNETQVLGAQATSPINYEFTYDLPSNSKSKKTDPKPVLTFTVESAEKRNEILVQGKKATAVDGRTFLILNIKINNPNDQGIKINTRDFFRLAVNGNQNEWLAPDIHNDPVEVQAISTKFTRVGFPVNLTDANLLLQVGQINGNKQQLPLSL